MFRVFVSFLLPCALFCEESVFFIHGFMRSKISMHKMERVFHQKGYQTINYGYPSKEKTIQEHGSDLVEVLKVHAGNHPGQTIHFITHSLGGIVLRSALNHHECPDEAKHGRAVLLGPPNQGSAFGYMLGRIHPFQKVFGTKAGKQLTSGEAFDDLGEIPATVDVLVISGTAGWNPIITGDNDLIVGVDESCLNRHHRHMCIPTLHTYMMYNETVIHNASRFIESFQAEAIVPERTSAS